MEGQRRPITVHEQDRLKPEDCRRVAALGLDFSPGGSDVLPPYLGLSADGRASYYVGAAWLAEGMALTVHPKIPDIDFMRIFAAALSAGVAPRYFEAAYTVRHDTPPIADTVLDTVLTPLLVAHFMSVMVPLATRGLKRSYVVREENLRGKVRGRIMPLHHLRQNVQRGQAGRVCCRYQEYSPDYPENRLLKRALLVAESLLLSLRADAGRLLSAVRGCLAAFGEVSADIAPSDVRQLRRDKLRGDYAEAVRLARRLLRRTDWAVGESGRTAGRVPEFAVDMSRVFEFHVLSLLHGCYGRQAVRFQESAGLMGRCDYLVPQERLVVDAKYKPDYPQRPPEDLRTDVREVAGYTRSGRIRRLLGVADGACVPCLMVYPEGTCCAPADALPATPLLEQARPLGDVCGCYTLGVPVPVTG